MIKNVQMRSMPKLIGSRSTVISLCEKLPEDLSSTVVSVDCSTVSSMSQGSVDEFCKQILGVRKSLELRLINPTARLANHALKSAELRGLSGLKVLREEN